MSPSEVSKSTDMVLTRYGRYRPEWLKFEVVMVREKVISDQRLWYYLFTISLCTMLF